MVLRKYIIKFLHKFFTLIWWRKIWVSSGFNISFFKKIKNIEKDHRVSASIGSIQKFSCRGSVRTSFIYNWKKSFERINKILNQTCIMNAKSKVKSENNHTFTFTPTEKIEVVFVLNRQKNVKLACRQASF